MDGNRVGKQYACEICGAVVMCVKPGAGALHCHGAPMELRATKPLPSSD
jgi:desulfoferrodoxin-like iron-binding protein